MLSSAHLAVEAQLESDNLYGTNKFFMEKTIPMVSSSFWHSDRTLAKKCKYLAGQSQFKTFSQLQIQLIRRNHEKFGNEPASQVKIHSCKSTEWHLAAELDQ